MFRKLGHSAEGMPLAEFRAFEHSDFDRFLIWSFTPPLVRLGRDEGVYRLPVNKTCFILTKKAETHGFLLHIEFLTDCTI
jgi:hypothetical protein